MIRCNLRSPANGLALLPRAMIRLILASLLLQNACSLRDVRVSIPEAVEVGDPAVLNCFFEMEGDETLYAVKWYRNMREFFRYTPKESPPAKKFNVTGINDTNVEISQSNATQVKLIETSEEMSGLFTCEVSADYPSFYTEAASSRMVVADLPVRKPVISGLKSQYRLNDLLHINCKVPGSRPAANITWFVNDVVEQRHVTERRRNLDGNLDQTMSQLSIHLRDHLFNHSGQYHPLRIRCLASVYNIYSEWVEKSVHLDGKSRIAQNKGKAENDAVESKIPKSSKGGDYWGNGRRQNSNRHNLLPPTDRPADESEAGFLEKVSTGSSSIAESHHISVYLVLLWLINLEVLRGQ